MKRLWQAIYSRSANDVKSTSTSCWRLVSVQSFDVMLLSGQAYSVSNSTANWVPSWAMSLGALLYTQQIYVTISQPARQLTQHNYEASSESLRCNRRKPTIPLLGHMKVIVVLATEQSPGGSQYSNCRFPSWSLRSVLGWPPVVKLGDKLLSPWIKTADVFLSPPYCANLSANK